jgi:hypothetical protein
MQTLSSSDPHRRQLPRADGSPSRAFRLLDDFQAGYIKFAGREPRTLEELAIALADNEHSRRLAEIKAMRKRLALLDGFLPELAKRGVKVWASDIHSSDGGKTMRLYPNMFVGNDDKLHAALLDVGFTEVERRSNRRDDTVTLKHGRWLIVAIDVSKPNASPTEATGERAA